jgi:chromate transporter
LFFATVIRMLQPIVMQRSLVAIGVVVVVFAAIGVFRWPLPPVLLVAIPASILLVYLMRKRAAP